MPLAMNDHDNDIERTQHHASYHAIGEALRALPAPQIPDDFTDRVLLAARETPQRKRPHYRRWAAAACMLVLGALGVYLYPQSAPPAAPESIAWTDDEPVWEDAAWPEMDTVQLARVMADLTPETEIAPDETATDTDLFDVMDMMDTVDEAVLQDLLRAWSQEG